MRVIAPRKLLFLAAIPFALFGTTGLALAACPPPHPLSPCDTPGFTGRLGSFSLRCGDKPPPPICRNTKGPPGPQGLPGKEGAPGPRGPSGGAVPGAAGPPGVAGPQGVIGVSGLSGPQGIAGQAGATGSQGATGLVGAAGAEGKTGSTGVTGSQGETGSTGAAGPQGATGLEGPTGPIGSKGAQGEAGPAGPAGATGLAGTTGPQGEEGPQGKVGATGSEGPQGKVGATGPEGPTGPTGSQGKAGAVGAQGPPGVAGPTGATGPEGSNGLSQYAYIYNLAAQTVEKEADVTFDSNGVITPGIKHTGGIPGDSGIEVVEAGIYEVTFSVSGTQANQMAIYLEGALVDGSIYGSEAGTQQNTGQAIFTAPAGGVITIRNHTSSAGVGLTTPIAGTQASSNASVVIEKLAGP